MRVGMLLGRIKQFFTVRRPARDHELLAEGAFAAKYPTKRLIPAMSSIFHQHADHCVVQLCDDWGGIPPHRSWWLVTRDGTCRELELEEAARFKAIPAWR